MPKCQGYAYSEETAIKQSDFLQIVQVHVPIIRGIWSRLAWSRKPYRYIDITAGPGTCPKSRGMDSSPMVFLDHAEAVGLEYEADLIEREKCCAEALSLATSRFHNVRVHANDHRTALGPILSSIKRNQFGMLYCDTSGNRPPWDMLAEWSHHPNLARLDIVVYLAANNAQKRPRGAGYVNDYLTDCMGAIQKKHWIVRQPSTACQWTFLIGTNWTDFPQFTRRGFYGSKTEEGAAILERLNWTERELKQRRDDSSQAELSLVS